MEYNKNRFTKVNDHKVLHKVRKQWVVLSMSMLALLGGGAAVTHVAAHANANNNRNGNTQNDAANVIKNRINASLTQAESTQNQTKQTVPAQNHNSSFAPANVTRQANVLHNRILRNVALTNGISTSSVNGRNTNPNNVTNQPKGSKIDQPAKVGDSNGTYRGTLHYTSKGGTVTFTGHINSSVSDFWNQSYGGVDAPMSGATKIVLGSDNTPFVFGNGNLQDAFNDTANNSVQEIDFHNVQGMNNVSNMSGFFGTMPQLKKIDFGHGFSLGRTGYTNVNQLFASGSKPGNVTCTYDKSDGLPNSFTNGMTGFNYSNLPSYEGLSYQYDSKTSTVTFQNGSASGSFNDFLAHGPNNIKNAKHIVFSSDVNLSGVNNYSSAFAWDNNVESVDMSKIKASSLANNANFNGAFMNDPQLYMVKYAPGFDSWNGGTGNEFMNDNNMSILSIPNNSAKTSFYGSSGLIDAKNGWRNASDNSVYDFTGGNIHPVGTFVRPVNNSSVQTGIYDGLAYVYDKSTNTIEFTGGNLNWSNNSQSYQHAFLGDQNSAPDVIKNAAHVKFDSNIECPIQNYSGLVIDDSHLKSIDLGPNFLNGIVISWNEKQANSAFKSDYNLQSIAIPDYFMTSGNPTTNAFQSDNKLIQLTIYPTTYTVPSGYPSPNFVSQTDNNNFNGTWYKASDFKTKSNPVSLINGAVQPGTYYSANYVPPKANTYYGMSYDYDAGTSTVTFSGGPLTWAPNDGSFLDKMPNKIKQAKNIVFSDNADLANAAGSSANSSAGNGDLTKMFSSDPYVNKITLGSSFSMMKIATRHMVKNFSTFQNDPNLQEVHIPDGFVNGDDTNPSQYGGNYQDDPSYDENLFYNDPQLSKLIISDKGGESKEGPIYGGTHLDDQTGIMSDAVYDGGGARIPLNRSQLNPGTYTIKTWNPASFQTDKNWIYRGEDHYVSDGAVTDWQNHTGASDYDGLSWRYSPSLKAVEFTGGTLNNTGWKCNRYNGNGASGQFIGNNDGSPKSNNPGQHPEAANACPQVIHDAHSIGFGPNVHVEQNTGYMFGDDSNVYSIALNENFGAEKPFEVNRTGMFASDVRLTKLTIPQGFIDTNNYGKWGGDVDTAMLVSDANLRTVRVNPTPDHPNYFPEYPHNQTVFDNNVTSYGSGKHGTQAPNLYKLDQTPVSYLNHNLDTGTYVTRVKPRADQWTSLHEGSADGPLVKINSSHDTITVGPGQLKGGQLGNYSADHEFASDLYTSGGDLVRSDILPNSNKDWTLQFQGGTTYLPSNAEFMFDGKDDNTSVGRYNFINNQVRHVKTDGLNGQNTQNAMGLFINNHDLSDLTVNYDHFGKTTGGVSNWYMAFGSDSLQYLNLSGLDTQGTTGTSSDPKDNSAAGSGAGHDGARDMFDADHSLVHLKLGGHFVMPNAKNVSEMISSDQNLQTVDGLSDTLANTKPVNTYWMFGDDRKLNQINLSDSFDTSNDVNTGMMFQSDYALTKLALGSHFNTNDVKNMHNMFLSDKGLNTFVIGSDGAKFDGSTGLPHTWYKVLDKAQPPHTRMTSTNLLDNNSHKGTWVTTPSQLKETVTFSDIYNASDKFSVPSPVTKTDPGTSDTYTVNAPRGWDFVNADGTLSDHPSSKVLNYSDDDQTVKIAPVHKGLTYDYNLAKQQVTFKHGTLNNNNAPEFMYNNTSRISNARTINFSDTVNVDPSTTQMYSLIRSDPSVVNVNLGNNFDTHSVTLMSNMFHSDAKLKHVNLGSKFNTSRVYNMSDMFRNDGSLSDFTFPSGFDTTHLNARGESDMFLNDNALKELTFYSPNTHLNPITTLSNPAHWHWYLLKSTGYTATTPGHILNDHANPNDQGTYPSHFFTTPGKLINNVTNTDPVDFVLEGSNVPAGYDGPTGQISSDKNDYQGEGNQSYTFNNQASGLKGMPAHYHIAGTQTMPYDGNTHQIQIAPDRIGEQINYVYNGNGHVNASEGNESVSDYYDQSSSVSSGTQSNGSNGLSAGWQVQSNDSFTFNGGSANVNVQPIQQNDTVKFELSGANIPSYSAGESDYASYAGSTGILASNSTSYSGNDYQATDAGSNSFSLGSSMAGVPSGYHEVNLKSGDNTDYDGQSDDHTVEIAPDTESVDVVYQYTSDGGTHKYTEGSDDMTKAYNVESDIKAGHTPGMKAGWELSDASGNYKFTYGKTNQVIVPVKAIPTSDKLNINLIYENAAGTTKISQKTMPINMYYHFGQKSYFYPSDLVLPDGDQIDYGPTKTQSSYTASDNQSGISWTSGTPNVYIKTNANPQPNTPNTSLITIRYYNQHGRQVGCAHVASGVVGKLSSDLVTTNVPQGYNLQLNQDDKYKFLKHDRNVSILVSGKKVTDNMLVNVISRDSDGNERITHHIEAVTGDVGDMATVKPSDLDYQPAGSLTDPADQDRTVRIDSDGSLSDPQITYLYNRIGRIYVHYVDPKGHQVGYGMIDPNDGGHHMGDVVDALKQTGANQPDGYTVNGGDPYNVTLNDDVQDVDVPVTSNQKYSESITVNQIKENMYGDVTGITSVNVPISNLKSDVATVDPYDYIPSGGYHVTDDDHNVSVDLNGSNTQVSFIYQQNLKSNQIGTVVVHYINTHGGGEIDQEVDHGTVGSSFNVKPYQNDIPSNVANNGNHYYYYDHTGSSVTSFSNGKQDVYIYVDPNNGTSNGASGTTGPNNGPDNPANQY